MYIPFPSEAVRNRRSCLLFGFGPFLRPKSSVVKGLVRFCDQKLMGCQGNL
jgi:hypothetical protein